MKNILTLLIILLTLGLATETQAADKPRSHNYRNKTRQIKMESKPIKASARRATTPTAAVTKPTEPLEPIKKGREAWKTYTSSEIPSHEELYPEEYPSFREQIASLFCCRRSIKKEPKVFDGLTAEEIKSLSPQDRKINKRYLINYYNTFMP